MEFWFFSQTKFLKLIVVYTQVNEVSAYAAYVVNDHLFGLKILYILKG